MMAREHQTEWPADLMCSYPLPKAIFGYSFKIDGNITTGSPAILLQEIPEERGEKVFMHDPHVEGGNINTENPDPMTILIGTVHPEFAQCRFAQGR